MIIACQCLGLGRKAAGLLYNSLSNLKHQVCSAYGLSTEYSPTCNNTFFGTGQGSGGLSHFWIALLHVILACLDNKLDGFKAINITGNIVSVRNEDLFVDGLDLVVDDSGGDVVDKLRKILNYIKNSSI